MAYQGISYTSASVTEYDTEYDPYSLQAEKDTEVPLPPVYVQGGPKKQSVHLAGLVRKSLRRKVIVRRFAYILCGIAIITIWIGVMIAFANQEAVYAEKNKDLDVQTAVNGRANLTGDAILQGTLRQFDVASRTLTMQWSGAVMSATGRGLIPLGTDDEESLIMEIAVYQDVAAVRDVEFEYLHKHNPNITELVPPFYALANRSAVRVGTLGLNEWDSFNTDIDLTQAVPGSVWQEPLFGYPFDFWSGSIVFASNFPTAVEGTNFTGSYVFSFARISTTDSIQNWKIRARSENSCQGDMPTNCELHVKVTAKRPAIVIFCVVVVLVINWLSTLAIFALTCESVFLRRPHILSEIDILGVCFSALFALPSVRSLLPAAPDFATLLDLIGIVPNVIIISICTTIVAFDRIVNRTIRKET